MGKEENKERKHKRKTGRIVLLVFFVVILFAGITIAALQFTGLYDFSGIIDKGHKKVASIVENGFGKENEGPIYQTNAVEGINTLFDKYYQAMAEGNKEVLTASVIDPSIYDDMTGTMQKAMLYTGYDNINCYTVPGINAQEFIVYVMCNLEIAGVNSSPLDIISYYVIKTDDGYKIDNGVLKPEVIELMSETSSDPSVQVLYQQVMEDTNNCIENDQGFADFYSEINSTK